MFPVINFAYIMALIYFLAGFVYASFVVISLRSNLQIRLWREYLTTNLFLILACFSYGLMTITIYEPLIHVFWAIGFSSYVIFMAIWLRFTSFMILIQQSLINKSFRYMLIIVTVLVAIISIFAIDVEFVKTPWGNQFVYTNTLFVLTVGLYLFVLSSIIIMNHIEWLRNSKLIRERKQQAMFLLLTLIVTPIGYSTDFVIPALNNIQLTVPPLKCVVMLLSATHLFMSLRKNNTISITPNNVSRYTFKSVNIPIIVLDINNTIRLLNEKAKSFLGESSIGQNIDNFILINDNKPRKKFFEETFDRKSIMVKTQDGIKDCEMLLNVENDKYNEALCKVITLMDMTDVYYDALTGIYNRRFLNENLNRVVSALARNNNYLSIFMVDVDCFKKYNDHYSHIEGDNCLITLAQALLSNVRRGEDFMVRYGGEEFTIVLPNTDESGARSFAETILNVVRDLKIPHATSDVTDIVTVSVGISVGIPSINDGLHYVKLADDMLYKSKENGRNRYTLINLDDNSEETL